MIFKTQEALAVYCKKDPHLSQLLQQLYNEYQTEFSRLSHELRNPVTLINSFLQLTETRYPQVNDFDTWSYVMENMNYLRLLLDDLSAYNHSTNLHKEEVFLPWLLESLAVSCRPSLSPISLIFEKNGAIPIGSFDKTRLRSVILNLIRNAKEALNGDPNGIIRLSLSFSQDVFTISISNNGPQIPSEHLPDLFSPFITHKESGTGLGLSIVSNIVKAHGGTIDVSSTPQETTFTIHLPLLFDE